MDLRMFGDRDREEEEAAGGSTGKISGSGTCERDAATLPCFFTVKEQR